jgi:arginine N-succinyltransferase
MKPSFEIIPTTQAPPGTPAPSEAGGLWLCAWALGGVLLGALHCQGSLGRGRARCSFHLGRVVHSAPELGLHQVQTTLQLGHDATGEAEISGLYLAPEGLARQAAAPGHPADPQAQASAEINSAAVADALLHAALAWLVQQAPARARWVIVELPGWRDAQGCSPVWDGLVRPFLPPGSLDEQAAVQRHGPALSTYLGAMLPRQLIHAAFLPPAAQQALGRCAASHQPWLQALQRAGFADWQHCRIEDGGPLLGRPLPPR